MSGRDVRVMPPEAIGKGDRLSKMSSSSPEGGKLVFRMADVHVVRKQELNRTHLVLLAKVHGDVRDLLFELDDAVTEQTCANVNTWFVDEETGKSKIRPHMVHEYFQSSLTVTRTGMFAKLHVLLPADYDHSAIQAGGRYDLELRAYGVRFLKTSLYLVWKIEGVAPAADFLEEDAPPPEPEPSVDVQAIRASLRHQAEDAMKRIHEQRQAVDARAQELAELCERLRDVDVALETDDVDRFEQAYQSLRAIGEIIS
jgi:hypothetical protein